MGSYILARRGMNMVSNDKYTTIKGVIMNQGFKYHVIVVRTIDEARVILDVCKKNPLLVKSWNIAEYYNFYRVTITARFRILDKYLDRKLKEARHL